MARERLRGFDVLLAVLAVGSVIPIWLVSLPPLQDFPQHVAAVRVLNDGWLPELGLDGRIEVDLSRTQYVAVYAVACALARITSALVACKLVLSAAIAGTPIAMRYLLTSLGSDRRHAIWGVPLAYNAHVILGLMNFVAGIPLAVLAMALAARLRATRRVAFSVGLSLCLLVLFFTHVVLFAFGLLGSLALLVERTRGRSLLASIAPFVPSAIAVAFWLRGSPAGSSTLAAVQGTLRGQTSGATRFDPLDKTLRELPEWLTDVFSGHLDRALLTGWLVLFVATAIFARDRDAAARSRWRVALLSPLAAIAAFVMPYQHEWIWPISGRFPLLACIFAPLLLPPMRARAGGLVVALVSLLAVTHVAQSAYAFHRFDVEEARGAEATIARIPTGASVVGLIYDVDSAHVGHHPFMHFVAYSQAAHGGVVAFSFAETATSPFSYGPSIPTPRLGFGWAPQQSSPRRLASFYEYALVRGQDPHLEALAREYAKTFEAGDWSLWRRTMDH